MNEKYEMMIKRLIEKIKPHEIPFSEPWKVLISTVLSQRTKDETTAMVSERLYKIYPDLESISKANLDHLENVLKPIGFYREKAKRIREIAKILINEYNGKVPEDKDLLMKLPGVGTKTANIVLSISFKKDYIAVDTHVHRISNRLGWVKTKTPEETEIELEKIIDKKYWKILNGILVEFGKNICKPVNPKCEICPLNDLCPSSKIVAKK
ncbi:MAG: endonuclease III domain-containing protein [Thermoplasmata archaeon]|nr:endonuclease III [Thermoplasmata archaeon]